MTDVTGRDRHRPEHHHAYPVAGNVYYRPRSTERRHRTTPSLPTPHIRPRPRRPQSIHIVSYPAGYTPPDLRPAALAKSKSSRFRKEKSNREQAKKDKKEDGSVHRSSPRRVIERVLGPLKFHLSQYVAVDNPTPPNIPSATGDLVPRPRPNTTSAPRPRPHSMLAIPPSATTSMLGTASMTGSANSPIMATAPHTSHRNSIMSVRSAKSIMSSSVTEVPKPVASGSGVSCSIILAEPNVFLTGFEHDGHPRNDAANSTALLRGKLQLNVSKNVKIKSVTLKLHGRARTEWPEGIPPIKVDQFEEESLRTQVLTFFHAAHETWETEFGNQCAFSLRNSAECPGSRRPASPSQSTTSLALKSRPAGHLTARDYKRLSLQSVQSRSFGKGDTPNPNIMQPKTYKVFYPGTYEYSFELPIDHHQLETTKLQFGSVKWELETIVERAGAFKPNLHGTKEVCIVRVPDQLSLEMTEPISISRQWEDQLHYDIMISGKSFPIGTKIPIAFKLTPLAKVQVHKLKVFVTESIEYWTNDRRVTRKDPGRKILLLEKSAGKPLDKQFEASEISFLSGGELTPEQRREARIAAQRRRSQEASRAHTTPQPLPDPADNLLGDLDLGLESYWGSTEIEMNVQIPTCEQMAKDKSLRLHPDCSWKNVNVYHWIKVSWSTRVFHGPRGTHISAVTNSFLIDRHAHLSPRSGRPGG